jgi:error-prone DNA polymerase
MIRKADTLGTFQIESRAQMSMLPRIKPRTFYDLVVEDAKGVMFITLEDETGIANLVVWPQVFEKFRRVVMGASMIAVRGRIQREGEVVHLVAHRLTDLSTELATVGSRDAAFPLPHGRGDQVTHAGGGPDPRELPPKGLRTRDIYIPDLHIDTIKVKSRTFH